jgi:GNAT superfamily N-acetyltransferase
VAVTIVRVTDAWPEGLDRLAEAAAAERVGIVGRLIAEWNAGDQRFDGAGEALFAAYANGALAGVGGVTAESRAPEPAIRMRRLYVLPERRRDGVGRILAGAMMQQGFQAAALLTVNAGASAAAAPFWESLGFRRVERPGITHELRLGHFR